ncbi:MAG: HAMP domain-containing histidine kinase [Spirochaetia bacterium]|nr:HAMP domain-containing histidine kinase [Spirochaetia bacterium]
MTSFLQRRPLLAAGVVVAGLLLLLAAQLTWWLIFFHINQERYAEALLKLDRQAEELAALGVPAGPDFIKVNGRWEIRPEVVEERNKAAQRKLAMLFSETLFVLTVVGYGSFRILRSVQGESRLAHEKTVFIDSVSHELKTPIASLLLDLQTLAKRKLSAAQTKELIDDGIREVRRLETQVNQLLQVGKTRSRIERARQTVDIAAVLRDYVASQSRRTEKDGIRISVNADQPALVAVDPEEFRRVCDNIVQNAVQYSDKEPVVRIQLSLEKGGAVACISFADQGLGIPEDERKNVFKPFYRLHKGNRPVRGTGLGLHLVDESIRAAGGSVKALPNTPRGTIIEVRLPISHG